MDAGTDVTLTLTVDGFSACADAVDTKTLAITAEPVVDAGSDSEVCASEASFDLSDAVTDASAAQFSTLSWATSGTGTFDDNTALLPVYTPSAADKSAGSVTLTLTANGNGSCASASSDMVLTITPVPVVDAGSDSEVCASEASFDLSDAVTDASAAQFSTLSWATSGTGTFDDNTALLPVYTPSAADKSAGSVTLTLTANGNGSCASASSDMVLTITPVPVVDAGSDSEVCASEASFDLSDAVTDASAAQFSTLSWATSGTGTFDDNTALLPVYTPSAADKSAGSVTLTLTANGNGSCASASSDMVLTITPVPVVDAGSDSEVCASEASFDLSDAVTDASAAQFSTLSWATSGTGTFDDNTALLPVYTPSAADKSAGSVTLTLTANGNGSCASASSDMILTITPVPIVDAGSDSEVCASEASFDLSDAVTDASAAQFSTLSWATSGTGTFDDNTSLLPVYTPSAADKSAGSVTLTLTANGNGSCASASSDMILTITPVPIVDAGSDSEVCASEASFDLSDAVTDASAAQFSTLSWATSGTGTFDDNTSLLPVYTPSAADKSAGSVTLTLTANGNGSCASASSDMVLTITPVPVVDAGSDSEVCASEASFDLSDAVTDASAAQFSTLSWATSGTGTFDDNTSLLPVYTPSAADKSAGSVTLTLTANGNGSCAAASSDMVLTITPVPVVDAGSDSEVCASEASFDLSDAVTDASAAQFSTLSWATSGTGTFDDNTSLLPVYTPSAADKSAGSVTLTLTANGNGSCASTSSDMILTITPVPIVDAGSDSEVCASEASFDLSDAVTDASAAQFSTLSWATSGTGTFDDNTSLLPVYTPSAADKSAGSVTLTLTANGNGSCAAASSDMVLTITPVPVVDPGSDSEVCASEASFDLSDAVTDASAAQFSTLSWATSGTGTFDDNTSLLPVYTPSAADKSAGSVTLTLTANGNGSCASTSSDMILTITPVPIVDAGSDSEVCASEASFDLSDAVTDASAAQFSTLSWATSGTGTFDDNTSLLPVYTPSAADKSAGSVTLTLTANGNGSCASASSDMVLTITPVPVVDAGSDSEVCASEASFDLSDAVTDASAAQFSTLSWATSGTGTFDDNTSLLPVYTPSAADKSAGSVTLTLTANGNGSCAAASSDMVLTITPVPVVDAGSDSEVCASEASFDLSDAVTDASAAQFSTLSWATSGTGTFDDNTALLPVYTPSAADKSAGSVTLTLTANGNGSCASASSDMILTITPVPIVDAGSDSEVCASEASFDLSDAVTDASAAQFSTLSWATSGTGTFDDNTSLLPVYTPSAADKSAGSVTLTLTANGNGSCASASSDMVLTITPVPVVDAGSDSEVCASEASFDLSDAVTDASAAQFSTLSWATSGTGTFDDNTSLLPVYTPSAADKSAGSVTLTLTANGNGSCASASSDMVLTINPLPIATITSTATEVCEADPFTLRGTISGGANAGTWRIKVGQDAAAENSGTLSATANNSGSWEAVFTPDGSYFGAVDFEFVASAPTTCADDIADYTLNIRSLPNVLNQSYSLCEDVAGTGITNVDLTSYNVDVTSEPLGNVNIDWFTNSSLTNPVNDPTDEDILNNSTYYARVTLAATNCFDKAQVDFQVNPQIVLTAGSNEEICDGETLDLSTSSSLPTQTNATTLVWTTSGDGSFDDASKLKPIYTPGPNDFTNSPITLTLTGSTTGPCSTVQDQMTVTIKPVPVINAVSDITLCPGETQSITNFSADISGGSWTWSATNASQLGLASSGTGDLPAFTAQSNNTGSVITSVITIDYTLNGCNSASETFNINVKPTPVIDDITNIQVCPGSAVNINFNANTTGETFNWSNNNTAVGNSLNASGTGDISFTAAANNSGSNITSTFTYSATLNGCTSVIKTFTVTLLPEPVISPIADIEVCSFDNILTSFSSNVAGSTFNWTNDNTASGIPASGTGNINVTATENLSGSDIISNITVTASRNGCTSGIETFTVTVKPKPILAAQSTLEICSNDAISEIVLTDNSSGASTISWTATNAAAIGLSAGSGTGNIPAFTANINNTTSSITSNVTVTSTWNGCISDQLNFQIRLKPTPIMNAVSNSELCAGDNYSIILANSLGASTTYSWTNSNTAIGLPASGSNNINFTAATNNTGSNIVSTITVTPTNNGCVGPDEVFTLTLKPTPVISTLNNVSLCSEEFISIPFTVDLADPNLTVMSSDNSLIQGGISINGNNIEFTTAINTSGADKTAVISLNASKNGCSNVEDFILTLKYRPVVSAIADRAAVCPGDIITGQTFSHSSGTGTFSWEITNPALIGDATPTSGTGNLPSFTAADNLTGSPIEGYVKYSSTRNGCLSLPDSFKISIKPAPVITNTDVVFCDNDNVNITFGNNTGTLNTSGDVTYFWTNSNTSIGVNNASGSTTDKITSGGFPANAGSGTTDNIAQIEVYASIDGCVGPPTTFEVRVKPLPAFTTPDAQFTQTTCSGDTFTFNPAANVSATQFNWSLTSNPGGVNGATPSGIGNISLDLINNTNTLQTVEYEISTLNDNCAGETKTLTIDVYPELKLSPLPAERVVCSGSSFQLNLSTTNNVNVSGEDVIYEWEVSSNNVGATNGSGTQLIETLINNKTNGERDTVFYYIRPTLNSGLCVGLRDTIPVVVNPDAEVFAGNDTIVCEGQPVLLEATIGKGASSGSWSGGDGTFNNRNSLSTFYTPDPDEIGKTITFTFTTNDPDGSIGPCTAISDQVNVTIDELPTALITGNPFPSGEYCVREEALVLEGNNMNYSSPDVEFFGAGVRYDASQEKYLFYPDSATVGGPYTITYQVTNSNGCINTDEVIVTVTNGPSADFSIPSALEVNDAYIVCFNQDPVELRPLEDIGVFSGNGVEFNSDGNPVFNPLNVDVTDTTEVTYTINDPSSGCLTSTSVFVYRLPRPDFEVEERKLCDINQPYAIIIDDLTAYTNDYDSILDVSYTQVDNNANRILSQNGDTITFDTPGVKSIDITWEFALGCSITQRKTVNVGNIESIDFTVDNIKVTNAPQAGTMFNVVLDTINLEIEDYIWSFGDGSPTETVAVGNIEHNYSQAGTYNIELTVIDEYGCSVSVTRTINIVPAISQANLPYLETFENGAGGWFTTSESNTSWMYTTQATAFSNEQNNSQYWMTAIDGQAGYTENERSYLVGPTFDLSSLEKPILSFDMYLDFQDGDLSALAVEYSLGNNEWKLLGSQDDQLNWYNDDRTEFFDRDIDRVGDAWADNSNNIDDENQAPFVWARVAHTLDHLKNESNITFRIALASSNYDETSLGVAIDNFFVGNNPNNVLFENFTSFETGENYLIQNEKLVKAIATPSTNLIPLEFHISYPEGDSLNARYPVGLDTRANNYSITSAPTFVLDGSKWNNQSEETAIDTAKILERSLQAPDTLVNIQIDNGANQNTVRFTSTIAADPKYADESIIIYYFIVEKRLTVNINGQNQTIYNVVRKTLPEINGTLVDNASLPNATTYEWPVNNIYAGNELAIVTVLQNVETNQVIQASITDISETKVNQNILALTPEIDFTKVDVYPIPTYDKVYVNFKSPLENQVSYFLMDNRGRIIKDGSIKIGQNMLELSFTDQSTGVYHLLLKDEEGNVSSKKIVFRD